MASITVVGDGTEEVVPGAAAGAAAGPGAPTAQQCVAPAQDTASSWPVPAGAGCPTAAGVPFCWPRTWGSTTGAFDVGAVVHAAAVSPSVTSTATRWVPPGRMARLSGRKGLEGTAQGH